MKRTLVVVVVHAALSIALLWLTLTFAVSAAEAQVPSNVDTLAVISTNAAIGDTFSVDIAITNVDTLGSYALRLTYDPSVIEPLTDTSVSGIDTTISVEFTLLRENAFEIYGGSVPQPGVVLFATFDFDADTTELFLPGEGDALRLDWQVVPTATPQVAPITFNNDPVHPESWNIITDLQGAVATRPVLTNGTVTVTLPCECPFPGDMDANGFYDAIDLNALIDILFFGGVDVIDPKCPVSRADWNADGFPDALDLNAAIAHIFFGGVPPTNPCP